MNILTRSTGWMDLSLSHLNTVIQRSREHTPNAANMQTYGVHKYFNLHDKEGRWRHIVHKNTKHETLKIVPIKKQSQASKKQRVKNMIGDCRLLSYSSLFKFVGGLPFFTTAKKWKCIQLRGFLLCYLSLCRAPRCRTHTSIKIEMESLL